MNRALRRQQTKEPKEGQSARSAARAIPRSGPSRAAPRREGRFGFIKAPRFITDVITELRKVVWPTRQDVMQMTVVVVIITILVGAVLGAIDVGFGWLIDNTVLR